MKVIRLSLIVFLLVLCLPFVHAVITLNPLSNRVYNLGDKVLFTGNVVSSNNTRANLNLLFNCGSSSVQIGVILLNLRAGQKSEFSSFITLPLSLNGNCKIIAELNDLEGKLLETKESNIFDVSNELKGSFQINKNNFQLGDELLIKGNVYKQNNEPVDGVLLVSFKKGDSVLFVDTLQVLSGLVTYSKILNRIPPSVSGIDLAFKDNFGNSKTFLNLFNIVVNSNFDVTLNLDKTSYSPGDTLHLNGYVGVGSAKPLTNINIEFTFENQVKNVALVSSKESFSFTYALVPKIRSGLHTLKIVATDEGGNYASKLIEYSVTPLPTTLTLSLNGTSYDPSEDVSYLATLTDQADEALQENIQVVLSKGNEILASGTTRTGTNGLITIPKDTKPGVLTLKVSGLGLTKEASVTVKEFKKLSAEVQGTNLVVQNLGNVPYKGAFDLLGNGEKKSTDVSINVGEKETIKLDKLFSPGSYTLDLPALGASFENVVIPKVTSFFDSINGNVVNRIAFNTKGTTRKTLLLLSFLILICSIGYLFLRKWKLHRRNRFVDPKYFKEFKRLEKVREVHKAEKPREYGKATQADIDDWKKRVQQSLKEQEAQKSNQQFVRHQRETIAQDKPREGMFNMFN